MERNEEIQAVILSAFMNYGDSDSRVDELSAEFVYDGKPAITRWERDDAYAAAMYDWNVRWKVRWLTDKSL